MSKLIIHRSAFISLLLGLSTVSACAAEGDALAIEATVEARHLPYGAILDPIFPLTNSDKVAGYTRCGDSALWTGSYLAAEAFHYKATQSPDALRNVRTAVAGLKGLVDVTGINLLARCMVPLQSPYAASIQAQESANGVYTNNSAGCIWVGNTSRDEYSGAMFGLAVAYDMVPDAALRASVSDVVTRLVDYINDHNWSVVMPGGESSTSFLLRPEQIVTFLAIGQRVNPDHFSGLSFQAQRDLYAANVPVPIAFDTASDDSYFKFNLDYINLYNLIRLEPGARRAIYLAAYSRLRSHTASHQNAFFNVIDRALNGPDTARDNETLTLLDGWLLRLRRDFGVNLSGTVPVCGDRACDPVPVWLRPNTDFLWQRSPFQLAVEGGAGIIETAGIDYILPYWMARAYGLQETTVVTSAAAPISVVAPGALGSIYGASLAGTTAAASSLPLPTSLAGVTVTVRDTNGTVASAPLLFVSPGQINFLMPDRMARGVAALTITGGTNSPVTALGAVGSVTPGLFSMNGTGSGVAAATAFSLSYGVSTPVPVFTCAAAACEAVPIDVSGPDSIFLTLYGTGIRNRTSLGNVLVTINGVEMPALYAGPQPNFAGLDQINVELSRDLRGSGISQVVLKVDQHRANSVTVNIR